MQTLTVDYDWTLDWTVDWALAIGRGSRFQVEGASFIGARAQIKTQILKTKK